MGRIWNAILRLFGAKAAGIEGAINEAANRAAQDPNVMSAEFDDVIRGHREKLLRLKKAVGNMEAVKAGLIGELEKTTEQLVEDQEIKNGSWAALEKLVKKLLASGVPREQIEANAEIKEARAIFDDTSSSVEVLRKQAEDYEGRIQATQVELDNYYVEHMEARRELEKMEQEKHSSVARVAIAKLKQETDDVRSGMAEDGSAEKLSRLRQVVRGVEGQATASSRIAGTDTAAIKAKYKATAAKRRTDGAFDTLFAGVEAANKAETVATESVVAEAPVVAVEKKTELPGG